MTKPTRVSEQVLKCGTNVGTCAGEERLIGVLIHRVSKNSDQHKSGNKNSLTITKRGRERERGKSFLPSNHKHVLLILSEYHHRIRAKTRKRTIPFNLKSKVEVIPGSHGGGITRRAIGADIH